MTNNPNWGSWGLPPAILSSIQTDPILHQASVLDEVNHVVEVTIIRPGEAKVTLDGAPISYSQEALENSLALWDGAACFCDHFNKSVRNIAVVFFSPWYDDGVKARLRFIDDTVYEMVSRIVADRDLGMPVPDIGISADIAINGERSNGTFDVTEISQVISADIVFSPAAGGSFDRVLNSVLAESGIAASSNDQPPAPPPDPAEGEPLVPEKRVRDLQSAADKLRNQVRNQEAQITTLQDQLTEAVSRYRDQVLAAHPEIPTELVSGNTVAEIDTSLEQARTLVDNVRSRLTDKVPPGAPARRGVDTSNMSPAQKISYGLKQRGAGS